MALWAALRSFTGAAATSEEVAKMYRGKLLACFYLTGPSSWIGLTASYRLQQITNNPYVGQYSEPVINTFLCTIVFQLLWLVGNAGLYRGRKEGGFRALQRDILPVNWNGIKVGMTFNLIVWPATSLIIAGLLFFNPKLATAIPGWGPAAIINTFFVQPQFMRVMGDFFERWSKVLAERYAEPTSPELGE